MYVYIYILIKYKLNMTVLYIFTEDSFPRLIFPEHTFKCVIFHPIPSL